VSVWLIIVAALLLLGFGIAAMLLALCYLLTKQDQDQFDPS
jgi:hypothetical protein